jgi:hypothetical protein
MHVMRWVLLVSLMTSVQGGWLIRRGDAQGHENGRVAIGDFAIKTTYANQALIADFRRKLVFEIDHDAKTVTSMTIAQYVKQGFASRRNDPEEPREPDRVAGTDCVKYSSHYSSSNKPGAAPTAGGWGGFEGCVASGVTMPAPYAQAFRNWLRETQLFGAHGVLLMLRSQVDGPWALNFTTLSIARQEIPAEEFVPPANYKRVPFTSN